MKTFLRKTILILVLSFFFRDHKMQQIKRMVGQGGDDDPSHSGKITINGLFRFLFRIVFSRVI